MLLDRVKAKTVAMGAAKYLVDLGLQRHVDGILGFFDDRIEDDEAAAWFKHALDFADDAGGIAEMMQAERHEGAIESRRLERQLVGLAGAQFIARDRILMMMADIEHRQRLVDADDACRDCICFDNGRATRPVPVAKSKITSPPLSVSASINLVVSWLRMSGQPALVELGGMSGIFEARFVIVAVNGRDRDRARGRRGRVVPMFTWRAHDHAPRHDACSCAMSFRGHDRDHASSCE